MWTAEFINCLEESTAAKPQVDEAIAIKNENLPRKIYKYRSDSHYSRENLRTDTVWMASPESYNDPYDSWLTFPCETLVALLKAALVDRFVEAMQLNGAISAQAIEEAKRSQEPFTSLLEHVRQLDSFAFKYWSEKAESYSSQLLGYAQTTVSQIEGFRKREKVCSLSAVNDSLLMWSHYGDNHKGFCIEYDLVPLGHEHFFRKNLYPILYSSKFYDLQLFAEKLAGGPRHDFRSMIPLLAMLHKFDGWEYEKEWRLMMETNNIEPDYSQPAPIPSKVFLGARFKSSDEKELLSICREKGIPLWQMRLASDKFSLSPQELGN